jgi:phosphocarrier protein
MGTSDLQVIERKLVVTNGLGLHARVATMIVQTLQSYTCSVRLIKGDVEVDAKSVLGLLLLAAKAGTEILARAEGPDGDQALEAISGLIQDHGSE